MSANAYTYNIYLFSEIVKAFTLKKCEQFVNISHLSVASAKILHELTGKCFVFTIVVNKYKEKRQNR